MLYSKRVRKKKQLTDPVEIIPFPNQKSQQVTKPHSTPSSVPKNPTNYNVQARPEAKILSAPTGQLNSTNISINKILNQKQEENNTSGNIHGNVPMEDFSFDQVKMAWRRYAHQAKSKFMETMYNAMIKRDPKFIEPSQLLMYVDNQIQIDYMNPHLQDLIGYMRAELKNYAVTVELKLSDEDQSEVKFLTGKDRFASMAKKNPNLHTFKNIFNLDIEF